MYKQRIALLLALVFVCSLTAWDRNNCNACPQPCCTPCEIPCCVWDPRCPPEQCAYNPAVMLNPCSCTNLFVTASFIYWKPEANYLLYAYTDNAILTPQQQTLMGEAVGLDFGYKPGFKVGLGYKLSRDQWDLYAQYTRFHSHTRGSRQLEDADRLVAPWVALANTNFLGSGGQRSYYRTAAAVWKLRLDILDGEIGRDFFVGKYLTFRPIVGLRNMWIKQTFNVNYDALLNGLSIHSFNRSHSWGIGPRFGLDTSWYFCGGLKVLGNFAISLLHTEDTAIAKQVNPLLPFLIGLPNDVFYRNKLKLHDLKPILDLSLGLGWGAPFFCDKWFFDFLVSYDFSMYWNQASILVGQTPVVATDGSNPLQKSIVGTPVENTGNLSIEGLTITARWDF